MQVSGSVVVITGASSGIGRAAARAFARRGASVALAARRTAHLEAAAAECERAGGRALVVPTDITDEAQVQELARRSLEHFGRLDVWINNAAVMLFARFLDSPPEDFRRLLETNFFGYVNGARAALPVFARQGRGVLINNASMNAIAGAPYNSAYVASKFAVRGWTEALRQEMRGSGVSVCTILPAAIDTPLFQHAANYTGRAPKPLNPTYSPELVARAMVSCVERPRREVIAGGAGRMLALLRAVSPALCERVVARLVEIDEFQNKPAAPTAGNLYHPVLDSHGASGGWKSRAKQGGNDGQQHPAAHAA